MCLVLVHVCAAGFYNVTSLLAAALFHILTINTPDFWVKNRHWIQDLVHHESAQQARLGADDAYNSYLTHHNHLGLAVIIVENWPSQTSKPEFCADICVVSASSKRAVLVRSVPLMHTKDTHASNHT
jgi:hypothetical protein